MPANILLFAFSALLLWFGAVWIVDSAAAIARKFHVSELVIGLTVVAVGTSSPEFMVTVSAALKNLPDISLSNIVGSNIFNLGIILGLLAIIRPLSTNKIMVRRDGLLLVCITALVSVLALNRSLDRVEGVLLLLVLTGYMLLLWLQRQKGRDVQPPTPSPGQRPACWRDWPKLLAGFAAVAAGGNFMVDAASAIATALGVSSWVIGVTIVAAGTSLPELVTSIAAGARGRDHMLIGNLIGSDIYNFAGVLGLTCVLRPLGLSTTALPSLFLVVGFLLLVLVFMRTGQRISRLEGFLLLVLGTARWAWYAL